MTMGIPSSSLTITLPSSHHRLQLYTPIYLQLYVDFTMGPIVVPSYYIVCLISDVIDGRNAPVETTTTIFPTCLLHVPMYTYIDKPRDFR